MLYAQVSGIKGHLRNARLKLVAAL